MLKTDVHDCRGYKQTHELVKQPSVNQGSCREGAIVERWDLKSPEALSLFMIFFGSIFCKFNIYQKKNFFLTSKENTLTNEKDVEVLLFGIKKN